MYKLKPTKKTIDQLVKAGKYDYVNSNINRTNFQLHPVAKEVELLHLGRYTTTEEILAEMETQGLKPATMTDLLHSGIQHPDEQRNFPIIALGSVWTNPFGYRYVGCLNGSADRRNASLHWTNPGLQWDDDYRFLAFRKSDLDTSDTLPSLGNLDRIENKLDKLMAHLGVEDV